MQEIVDIYGLRQPLFRFEWPVFEMKIIPLKDYVEQQRMATKKELIPETQQLLEGIGVISTMKLSSFLPTQRDVPT